MRRSLGWAFLGLLSLSAPAVLKGLPEEGERPNVNDKLLLYSVHGVLDADFPAKLQEEVTGYRDREPDIHTILLTIDSTGTEKGRLQPAEEAARFLLNLKDVRVIARICQDRSAGNASALLALAARDLLMSPGARLGFLPDGEKAKVEVPDGDEKESGRAREVFRDFGSLRRGPIGKSHLASSMVSRFHPAIYKVWFEKAAGKEGEGEDQFLTQKEIEGLDPEDRQRKKSEMLVVPSGQKLTLDQKTALDFGFARPVESDDIHELLHKLKLNYGDENIIDLDRGGSLKPNPPSVQTLVDFLSHPVVRFLLLLGGTLGLLLEFKMPGTLIPSLGSLACFAVFFITGLFQPTDGVATTSVWEVLLFVIGMGLVAVELLLLPGVLIFGISGAALSLIAIVLAMVPPSGSTVDYKEAITTMVASSGTSALIFLLVLRFLPRSRFFSKSGIVIYSSIQGTPTADSAIEAQTRDAALIGKVGTAITPLRPAGTAEIDGARIDVVCEGDFIETGEKVQVIDLDGTRTLVRRA